MGSWGTPQQLRPMQPMIVCTQRGREVQNAVIRKINSVSGQFCYVAISKHFFSVPARKQERLLERKM